MLVVEFCDTLWFLFVRHVCFEILKALLEFICELLESVFLGHKLDELVLRILEVLDALDQSWLLGWDQLARVDEH